MKTTEQKNNKKRNKIIGLVIIIIALLLLLRGCTGGDNQFTKLFKQVDVFLEVNKEKTKSRDQVYKIAKIIEDSRSKKTKDIIKDFKLIGNVSTSELETQSTLITNNTDVDLNKLIENHKRLVKKYDSKIALEQVSLIVAIIVQLDDFKENNNTLNDEGIDQVQRLLTSYYGYLVAYEIRMQPEPKRVETYKTITKVQTNVKEIIKFAPNMDHKFLNTLTGISNIIGKVKLENDHSVEMLKDVVEDLNTLDSEYVEPFKNLISDFIIIIEENSLEISRLNDEVNAANRELENISNENESLKDRLTNTQDEVISARDALNALNEQLEACAKELNDTKEISAAREEELLNAITDMEAQLEAVVQANQEYENALANANEELQQAYEVQTGLHVIVNQYASNIADLTNELEATKTMLADEKTENINLNLQIDTLLIKTSNDAMYISQLEDANAYLESLIEVKDIDFQNKLLEIESLNYQLDSINADYILLQENLDNQVTRNEALEELLNDSNTKNENLEALLSTANTENISLTLQNQDILNQLNVAQQNIAALNLEKTDLMTINLLMQEELNTLNQELINCHELLSAKELEISDLTTSLNNLNTITDTLRADIAERDLTIKDLSEAIQEKNDQINNLNGQIAAMNVSIENLSIDKQLLEEALTNCKDELDALLADNNTLNNDIVQKNEEIQALSTLLDQTLIGLNTAQAEISALQDIVSSSQFANEQLSNELTAAQNTI